MIALSIRCLTGGCLLLATVLMSERVQAMDMSDLVTIEPRIFEDFVQQPESRWTYVADGVMGGVSQGQATFLKEDGRQVLRLSGAVSTDNNGGFIQVRHRLQQALPNDTKGLRLTVRGNGEDYYVFLRTKGLNRVWHSYRHKLTPRADWGAFDLMLDEFYPSHHGMAAGFRAEDIISIGLVAYGRDHEAEFDIQSIALF